MGRANVRDRRSNVRLMFSVGITTHAEWLRWWTCSSFAFVSLRLGSGQVYSAMPRTGVTNTRRPPSAERVVRLTMSAAEEEELGIRLQREVGRPYDYLGPFRASIWPGNAEHKFGIYDAEYLVQHLQPFGFFLGQPPGAWTAGSMWSHCLARTDERLTIFSP